MPYLPESGFQYVSCVLVSDVYDPSLYDTREESMTEYPCGCSMISMSHSESPLIVRHHQHVPLLHYVHFRYAIALHVYSRFVQEEHQVQLHDKFYLFYDSGVHREDIRESVYL